MNDREALLELLQRYFDGLYRGCAELLRGVFHPQARLLGEVRGEFVHRELEAYLELVAARRSPMQEGEAQRMEVLSLQIHGAIAVATARIDMLGNHFVNQLGLLKQDGRWLVVNKLYTHLDNMP